ncbi:PQQ-binding-like beta-propeller repeat protein [Micromonospora sp. DT62]|uniref:outer membrane protein assembly factor BamB family protein n=1 Tax=Micromonospora sp. DT62 TaxID=3416521 RepID=UPI003CFAEF12
MRFVTRGGLMRRRVAAGSAAVLALAVGVSGCADDKPPPPPPPQTASASPAESSALDPPLAFAAKPVRIPLPSRMFQVRDGAAYLLEGNNALAAYDLATGARRWSAPLAGPPVRLGNTGPMIAEVDGRPTAFVTYRVEIAGSGTVPDRTVLRVASFGLADGAPGWQSDVDDRGIPDDGSLGVDKVVAASSDHVVLSTDSYDTGGVSGDFTAVLDARTGKTRWTEPAFQARALDGDVVAGMSSEPHPDRTPSSTIGLAASDGSQVWAHEETRPVGNLINGPLGGGLLQVYPVGRRGDGPNGIVDLKTGREVIRLETGGSSSVCRYDDESVVVCSQHLSSRNGTMVAYDATSHKRLWQVPEKGSGREAPRITAARRGMVYGSTSNGPLILDARTGQDKVTDLPFVPEVVVPGFGIEVEQREMTVHPAVG